ncbi:MAG TPA: hypothetical protein VGX52_07595 [Burkholderiales bacterium]|nr:hypothetical protein [Burkholderiales bacterium]
MLGQAAVAMWWDVASEMRAEWEDWHSSEHMPERLAIPGFLRGTRWVALSGEPSYFVLYEVTHLAAITGGAYLERLNNPTPWSRKMMPHHRNMVRSLCLLREGYGGGVAQAMATVRFSGMPKCDLPRGKGLTSAHFLESQPMPGGQTAEQKIRGGDATADWVLLIGGTDVEAVAKNLVPEGIVGVYRPAYSLSAGEIA